ncbi:hypothetical protein ACFX2A_004363 [Malus domestica]
MLPISEDEVRHTVSQIPVDKSPGPNGFTGSFDHEYWDVIGKDVVDMVKAFWFSGKLLQKVNHTHLVLIPKMDMMHLISANQSVLVAGRQIQDNILVVHEILHSLNQQSDDDDTFIAMKLDMANAYYDIPTRGPPYLRLDSTVL